MPIHPIPPGSLVLENTPHAKLQLRRASFKYVAKELRDMGLPDLADFVASLTPAPDTIEPNDSADKTMVFVLPPAMRATV